MIRTETTSGVATITLDRADKRNALTPAMLGDLAKAISDVEGRANVILLRGEGSVFCAGFDLSLCRDDSAALGELLTGLSECVRALRGSSAPVVIACHGAAIAGGCALLGGADVVVADRGAKLGYPVVRLGISPAVSAPFLRQQVGDGPARARLLDPELISGERGHELGLVQELVESREDVGGAAESIAGSIAAKPSSATSETKRWLSIIEGRPPDGRGHPALMALDVSLSLVGSEEERSRLAELWSA